MFYINHSNIDMFSNLGINFANVAIIYIIYNIIKTKHHFSTIIIMNNNYNIDNVILSNKNISQDNTR